MWLLFGAGAVISAVLNLLCLFYRKHVVWLGFVSISLAALTICAFYSDSASRVLHEDWSGLLDIMPMMNSILWWFIGILILVNSLACFSRNK
ncbi:Uncharacterised protein [Chlamydia trachomatis]|nr:Uncharacterised protein [Chlamydia trachomatis]